MAHIEQILYSGKPVICCLKTFEALDSEAVAKNGILPMPGNGEKGTGWHAVLCVGYDHPRQQVLVRNSYGEDWGLGGYFWMPYEYFSNHRLVTDMWVISAMAHGAERGAGASEQQPSIAS